jgi:hypothetical protein
MLLSIHCLFLGGGLGEVCKSLTALELGILDHACPWSVKCRSLKGTVRRTSISIAGEVASPGDEGLAFVLSRGDGVCADGRDDGRVGQLRLGRDDAVGDEVVDALNHGSALVHTRSAMHPTECSSCLTSTAVPSLKAHLTTSASSEVPLTNSLFSSADQNLLKSWSLIRCQTSLKGASMTADSLTEVEVGMRPDIVACMGQLVSGECVVLRGCYWEAGMAICYGGVKFGGLVGRMFVSSLAMAS